MSIVLYVRPGEKPRPFNTHRAYQPGARCLHGGKLWEAGNAGVAEGTYIPGECDEYHWKEVKEDD